MGASEVLMVSMDDSKGGYPYVVRTYQEGDALGINTQFNRIFNLKRSLDEWKWKFSPPNGCRIMIACDDYNHVITHYSVLLDKLQYFGEEFVVGQSVDTFSAKIPLAIRTRVFESVVHAFFREFGQKDDVSLMYGFPGSRILKLGKMRLDYGEASPIKYWEKRISTTHRHTASPRNGVGWNARKVDLLWNYSRHRYNVSLIRDNAWFQKRYFSRPGHNYQYYIVKKLGKYKALVVFRHMKDGIELIDMIWDGRGKGSLQMIDEKLVSEAVRKGCSKISMWLQGDPLAEGIFLTLDWKNLPEPHSLHLVTKSFHPRIMRDASLKEFYLTKGCSDII